MEAHKERRIGVNTLNLKRENELVIVRLQNIIGRSKQTMEDKQSVLTAQDIESLFGLRSDFFHRAMDYVKKKSKTKKLIYNEKLSEWKKYYRMIYGDSVDENLFLKHTYFALLLKSLAVIELSIVQNLDLDEAYADSLSNNLNALQVFEFEIFYWTDFDFKLFEMLYNQIENNVYAREDLFFSIYQQVFFTETRHKIGEYYTPNHLVRIMVDNSYEIGKKVLDPSCGSGSFLIEIISRILNSNKTDEEMVAAIDNVYGFDINPLAIMTAKINILLLFLESFEYGRIPLIKIFLVDSLFPDFDKEHFYLEVENLYHSYDLVIGNPPWLTYKDLTDKSYQKRIRQLADELGIKPSSQYITHIELAALFFYNIPLKFLKTNGFVFFVLTKSVLNGDHCHKFRAFSIFSKNIEIWDFPNTYFFNIPHICLKAEFIGKNNSIDIQDRYPIKTRIYTHDMRLREETSYSTLKIGSDGARLLLLERDIHVLSKVDKSPYRDVFFQGATLVPRTLVFFQIENKTENSYHISSDPDIITRSKKSWRYYFQNKEIESIFRYRTFLNKDIIPFYLTRKRNVFLPINLSTYKFNEDYLAKFPKASQFYKEVNEFYQQHKKDTSDIMNLFDNLNYWNKLSKQRKNQKFLTVYNASGSNIKAAVINNHKTNIIIGSENYYYPAESKDEAYYLCGILNSPVLTRNMKLIKSSRHIHKRPFTFYIPKFNEQDENHKELVRMTKSCEAVAIDLYRNNPKINAEKVRIIMRKKLDFINEFTNKIVFS